MVMEVMNLSLKYIVLTLCICYDLKCHGVCISKGEHL